MTFILEVIGTVTFAFAGAFVAIDYDLDWLGIILMAACTACGGGMTRDIIIGNTPPMLFRNPIYVSMAPAAETVRAAGARLRDGRRRPRTQHHRALRLHGAHTDAARRRFAQRGGLDRRRILGISEEIGGQPNFSGSGAATFVGAIASRAPELRPSSMR